MDDSFCNAKPIAAKEQVGAQRKKSLCVNIRVTGLEA
jgi:hypothetical protein